MKKFIFVLILAVLVFPTVFAQRGSLTLLAVSNDGENISGSIADLYLEIEPGNGRVFVDTFPLTKLDTQVSTRLAKEVACSYLEMNCDYYNFYYTIRSNSPIIAGPSAGAAITALTISLLGDIDINEKVAVTGTINSGGLVGPVGGLREKIEAAADNGLEKVLIPFGERYLMLPKEDQKNITAERKAIDIENTTLKDLLEEEKRIDLVKYGETLGIEVVEVSDVNDLLTEFTGEIYSDENGDIKIDDKYLNVMSKLALELCERSKKLSNQVDKDKMEFLVLDKRYVEQYDSAIDLEDKGLKAYRDKNYYPSASFCFGSSVKFGNIVLAMKNLSNEELLLKIDSVEKEIDDYKKPEYKTITDLQAYMVVEERMSDALQSLDNARAYLEMNETYMANLDIAYAIERRFSAYAWSIFIDGKGKKFDIGTEELKRSCEKKLGEAEERYQYMGYFVPGYLADTRRTIDEAYMDFSNGRYEACLFKASKSKAEVDVILSAFGVEEENIDALIERKHKIIEKIIVKQIEKGVFPVVGYSYFEYSKTLMDTDKYSSLLYAEYALEMSNLDSYFPEKDIIRISDQDRSEFLIFFLGMLAGILFGVFIVFFADKIRRR